MIKVILDKEKLKKALKKNLEDILGATSDVYRQIALELIPVIHDRIHIQGKAADNREIGDYSLAYVRIRTKRNKRSADPKVILSLTRQMENDYAVIATSRGWGIGFSNQLNLQKAKWNNKRYDGRPIYDLTAEEVKLITSLLTQIISKQFK